MQRSGSVCWLLGLALATAVPLSASSDEECDRWLKISSLQKRKIVLDSFKKKTRRIANPERDRCINEAAASIQTEVDAACRNGSVLRTAWADSGLGWSVTCTAVVARSRAGHRVTLADRKQIRKAWDDCVEREGDPESCRKPVLEYYITQANATDLSECAAFANLPTGSRVNEVHDRIQMRFSIA